MCKISLHAEAYVIYMYQMSSHAEAYVTTFLNKTNKSSETNAADPQP